MKNIYQSPVMQCVRLACEDVLTESQQTENELPIIWDTLE